MGSITVVSSLCVTEEALLFQEKVWRGVHLGVSLVTPLDGLLDTHYDVTQRNEERKCHVLAGTKYTIAVGRLKEEVRMVDIS